MAITPQTQLPRSLYRASQTRELDRIIIEEHGIPGLCLMERAGAVAFACLQRHWPLSPPYRHVGVICGTGNNAGDAYVLARLAYLAGYRVSILQLGDVQSLHGDALSAYRYLRQTGLSEQVFTPQALHDCDILVDGVFGTGLDREIRDNWAKAVNSMNDAPAPVLALDIPSGLHADTGAILGCAVRAAVSVTFIGLKQGMLSGAGPDCCGRLYFSDLGAPAAAYASVPATALRLSGDSTTLPPRRRHAHKGDFGHVLIVGGEQGYTGAAQLAAQGALRSGAGKVSLATRADHAVLMSLQTPEIMSHGVEDAGALEKLAAIADVIVIGPGLGQAAWGRDMLQAVLKTGKALVVDADALNLLTRQAQVLPDAILTPHPGEAARLLGIDTKAVEADRFAVARQIRLDYGGVCVLKGAGTIIDAADRLPAVCHAGNPGMACGGMGDVLSGIIGALRAQGLSAAEATQTGVCLHAAAADAAAREKSERTLLPSDVIKQLRV